MIDLNSKFENIKIKKIPTYEEFEKKLENGLYKNCEVVEYLNEYGRLTKAKIFYLKTDNSYLADIEYHKRTQWREASYLYKVGRKIWDKWKKEGKIPECIVEQVENDLPYKKPIVLFDFDKEI